MRVSIEKGYHSPIQELMERLQTDDPKLAVHHIIGCWIAANSKPAQAIALLVKRYGNHLLESWEVTSTQAPERVQPPVAAIAPPVDANEKWTQWQL